MPALKYLALALLATLAVADNCKKGTSYCGSTLISIGKPIPREKRRGSDCFDVGDGNAYKAQIDQTLYDEGWPPGTDGNDFLFGCAGGEYGDIYFVAKCQHGCHDSGKDADDECNV
jgi:hypothetical protein